MPRFRHHALTILAAMLSTATPVLANEIRWQHDIEAAKAEAQKSGRLVLVHVWADGCGPCQALENNVFNQPGVASALEAQFVPVKLNANEYPATAQGFGITRVPTDVILTPDGRLIAKFISPATPAAYVAETTQAANQYRSQPGHVYQVAAANAPQPPMLNPAYADLKVAAAVPPAMTPATASQPPASPVGQSVAATPPSMFAPPTVITPPTATPNALAADRYGTPPASPSPAAPAMPPSPSQTANPYFTAVPPTVSPTYTPPQSSPQPPIAAPVTGYEATPPTVPITPAPAQEPAAPPAAAAPTQPTAAAPPTQSNLPAGAPPLGFDGYCPVSMRTQWKWVPGDVRYGAIHRGRTYLFAGPQEQQQFLANPDEYAPALSGMDPVLAIDHRQSVPGIREHSLDYDNQFFLFSSEATLEQFTANPQRYTAGVRQAMGMQPAQR